MSPAPTIAFQFMICFPSFPVPKERGALPVLQLGGGRLHTAYSMFRRRIQAGVSGSGNHEAIHEAIRQDHCQGAGRLCGYCEGGVSGTYEG